MELLLCIGIFIGKILEIVTYTLRTIMATRNKKGVVTLLGFINNTFGIINLATVASAITSSPFRVISYALGEATGTYIGMIMDKKLAIGNNVMTIIINKNIMKKIIDKLNENNFKTTYMVGKGYKEDRAVIKIFIERKDEQKVKDILTKENAHAVIFESKLLNIKNQSA